MMLFKDKHIKDIKEGRKTVTRRCWKRKMAKQGGIYPMQQRMFQPKSECPGFIRVTEEPFKQRLGDMTEADAQMEGGYSLAEFKRLWKKYSGEEWNPDLEVWVVPLENYPMED